MTRYLWSDRQRTWVLPEVAYAERQEGRVNLRSLLPSPGVILDTMDGIFHPVTGAVIDSKSKFRKITKASGCEEVGNEKPSPRRAPPKKLDKRKRREDIGRAIYQLKNGARA